MSRKADDSMDNTGYDVRSLAKFAARSVEPPLTGSTDTILDHSNTILGSDHLAPHLGYAIVASEIEGEETYVESQIAQRIHPVTNQIDSLEMGAMNSKMLQENLAPESADVEIEIKRKGKAKMRAELKIMKLEEEK